MWYEKKMFSDICSCGISKILYCVAVYARNDMVTRIHMNKKAKWMMFVYYGKQCVIFFGTLQ